MLKLRNDNLQAAYNLCVRVPDRRLVRLTLSAKRSSRGDSVTHVDTAAKTRTSEPGGGEGAAPASAAIDFAHLRRFTLGDAGLELEVLRLFIDQVPITLADLKRASTSKQWATAAHTLKGSARAVGAWRLAKLAEGAERLSDLSDPAACDRMVRELDEAAAEARAYIVNLAPPA
jgi:HPt (histidine-containing phosphotransfer) domain-containing protein